MKQFTAAILITLIAASSLAWGADQKFVKPSPKDKCPVCGMFVAKYPDFVAEVTFKDGSYAVFDGAKDMFKYYFNLKKYAPAKRVEDISAIYVTDYYNLEPIDGFTAWYVTGSDVFGPMGKELIPFAKEPDARGFMKDHKGKSLLRFKDVRVELIRGLD
jgi:copper chaperone NosL